MVLAQGLHQTSRAKRGVRLRWRARDSIASEELPQIR